MHGIFFFKFSEYVPFRLILPGSLDLALLFVLCLFTVIVGGFSTSPHLRKAVLRYFIIRIMFLPTQVHVLRPRFNHIACHQFHLHCPRRQLDTSFPWFLKFPSFLVFQSFACVDQLQPFLGLSDSTCIPRLPSTVYWFPSFPLVRASAFCTLQGTDFLQCAGTCIAN